MSDDNLLRNKPQQARSLKRFNHILDTAAQLFEKDGYEAVTTNHIAATANVSIGSLYRFFPNKEVVLEALIERYREVLQDVFPQDIAPPRTIGDILDEMFANLRQFSSQHAGFGAIFLNVESVAAKEQVIRADTVAWVERLLAAQYPHLTADKRQIAAEVGVGIVKGIMPLMQPPLSYPPEIVTYEMKATILAYMADFLKRHNEV